MYAPRLIVASALILTGCSAAEFTSNKDAVLAKSVFGEATGSIRQPQDAGNGIRQPASGEDASGNVRQPSEDEDDDFPGMIRQPIDIGNMIRQPDGTDDEVDFLLICSDRRSEDHGNFKRAVAQNQPIQLAVGGKVCTTNVNEIKALVTKKSFTIADARRLCPGLVPESGKWASVELIINGESRAAKRGTIELIYALNKDTQPASEVADELCDKNSSPLVVHVASDINNPLPIALSSQDDGIYFDLLGARNNHSLVRISWFTNHDYRLLTLPDAQGHVNGINELFGDNTLGPDGLFADNGYAALAKYDGTTVDGMFQIAKPDGRIDQTPSIRACACGWTKTSTAKLSAASCRAYAGPVLPTSIWNSRTSTRKPTSTAT